MDGYQACLKVFMCLWLSLQREGGRTHVKAKTLSWGEINILLAHLDFGVCELICFEKVKTEN